MRLRPCSLLLFVTVLLGQAPFVDAQRKAASSQIDPQGEALLARLQTVSNLSARFTEKKQIALLDAPLVSRGSLYYLRPGNLVRRVDFPEKSRMRLAHSKLELSGPSGASKIDLDSQPAVRELIVSFLYLLEGNAAALKRNYRLSLKSGREDAWTLELDPSTPALRKLITHMTLAGQGLQVQTLIVKETTGDISTTTFDNIQINREFSAKERRQIFGIQSPQH